MGILNIHRIDLTNVGDKYSPPTKYFDFPKGTKVLEIEDIREPRDFHSDVVVIGGGGLIASFFEEILDNIYQSNPRKLIGWGIGHNYHGEKEINLPSLDNFDALGIRDYDFGYDWVPCSTCMDPLFDQEYGKKHDIVVYEHCRRPLAIEGFEKMSAQGKDLSDVVPFLGSSEIVLTNTYHGVYWATLLGKKVIIVNPFSSKFYGMKHKHPIASEDNWKSKLEQINSYPNALEESRNANVTFHKSLEQML